MGSSGEVMCLTRDELKEANCCRFCGYGAKKETVDGDEFIRMYEKLVVEGDDLKTVTLDVVINKYLPITVSSQELYYPQVICSPCTSSLNLTVEFFQKIAKGQKILANIINEVSQVKVQLQDNVCDTETSPLVFSGENPIILAPKRRGRPRRDPNKPKTPKLDVPVSSEYLESKPKRQSRRPVRYDPVSSNSLNEVVIKEEAPEATEGTESEGFPFLNQENVVGDIAVGADAVKTSEPSTPGDLKTDNNNLILQNMSSEFTSLSRTDNLMDISKLSVIMDGDEEVDTSLNLETTVPDSGMGHCRKAEVVPGCMHLSDTAASAEVADATAITKLDSGSQEDDDAVVCLTQEHVTKERDNDSDTSVKTVDFVVKKKSKRGRKKTRRKSGKKKIECEICKKEFSHPSSLAYHRNAAHGDEKKFACTICSKAFTHKQLLLNHSYVHSDEKVFACNVCPAKFKSKASLYTHNKSIHTTNNAYTCDHCGSRFNLKSSLKAHLRLHTGEKPYSCEFCHKKFSQKSNYTEHRRIHTGERPYKCDIANCDKAFTTASQLRSHKITHTGSKQYLCSICGRGFTHGENFKYHMRRHNGEKPLECPICLKQFTEPWSLKKHCRMHTGEKPYTCEVCNKLFSDPSNYAKHKRAHHFDGVGQELQESIQRQVQSNQLVLNTNMKSEDASEDSHVVSQIIDGTEQTVEDSAADSGYVHILNAENLTSLEEGTQDGQVIYLYPDELQYYTIMISENQDTMEARPNEEALQALGGTIALAVDADLAAQYFNIDNVSNACITGSTITETEEVASVPITNEEEISTDCVESSKSDLPKE